MDTSDKRLLVMPRMSKEKCKFAGIKISIMEGIMIFLMELLTVITYILAMPSPFILIAWFLSKGIIRSSAKRDGMSQ